MAAYAAWIYFLRDGDGLHFMDGAFRNGWIALAIAAALAGAAVYGWTAGRKNDIQWFKAMAGVAVVLLLFLGLLLVQFKAETPFSMMGISYLALAGDYGLNWFERKPGRPGFPLR